jgi:hypothetical protein
VPKVRVTLDANLGRVPQPSAFFLRRLGPAGSNFYIEAADNGFMWRVPEEE